MSSIDDLLATSIISGNGNLDPTYPDVEKEILLNPNSITVREGTLVKYSVEKNGYVPVSDSLVAKNFRHDIVVNLKKYVTLILKVSFVPKNGDTGLPDIILTAPAYSDISAVEYSPESTSATVVAQRSITVPENTYVTYMITKAGFNTKKGNVKVVSTNIFPVSLNDNSYTFTVEPNPSDADVILIAERPLGPQIGNSILVEGKPNSPSASSPTSTITYTVSKNGYETVSGTIPYITSDTTISVPIKKFFSFAVYGIYPEDSVAKITNIVGAKLWEPQKFYDLHALVKYEDKFYNAIDEHTSTMTFDPSKWVLISNEAWVLDGNIVHYEVKRTGYREVKTSITVKKNELINVRLESVGGFCPEDTDNDLFCMESNEAMSFQSEGATDINIEKYSLTVNPTPDDSNVEIKWNGNTYYQRELRDIPDGDIVYYKVLKEHYDPQEKLVSIVDDRVEEPVIDLENKTLTITTNVEDANIVLRCNGEVVNDNVMTVKYGDTIEYEISREYYVSVQDSVLMNEDKNIDITLEREIYTVTVNTDPSGQGKYLSLYTDYGNASSETGTASITVPSEAEIRWSTRADGYYSNNGVFNAEKTGIVTIPMTSAPSYTFTINPNPSDATVTIRYNGTSYNSKSLVVPYGGAIEWSVSRSGYISQSGSQTMYDNDTKNIILSYSSGTVVFNSRNPGTTTKFIPTGNYKLEIVGGGGSGCTTTNWSEYCHCAGGGSGAFIRGTKHVEGGNYSIVVGGGGYATGINGGNGAKGGTSSVFGEKANGGDHGYTAGYYGEKHGGAGGTADTTLTFVGSNNGGEDGVWGCNGGYSSYNGQADGPGAGGGNGAAGQSGYIKITAV